MEYTIPPALYAMVTVDSDRLINCLLMVEGNPWHQAGGGLGYTRGAWYEDTDLPYEKASSPVHARRVAKLRIARFIAAANRVGLHPEPANIADMWRRGFARALQRMRDRRGFGEMEYGWRAANLYYERQSTQSQ
jgi:hypothetical protein